MRDRPVSVRVRYARAGTRWAAVALLCLPGCGDASHDEPAPRSDRASASARSQQCTTSELRTRLEPVAGAGRALEIRAAENRELPGVDASVEESAGSGSATQGIRLRDTRSGQILQVDFTTPFDQMVSRFPVPEAIPKDEGARWIRMIEALAFERVCDRPDPSLRWLLEPRQRPHWIEGRLEMPQTYAWLRTDPDRGRREWVQYLGANHARLGEGEAAGAFQEIARQGRRRLLRSAHGAVLVDDADVRHAWVYVHRGGHKLRWPSVVGGTLEGDTVTLELGGDPMDPRKRIAQIDLASGRVEEWRVP